MTWLGRKLDSLVGAVFAGVFGALASQFDGFVQQYLQRLGGHRDEAQRQLTAIMEGDRYREFAAPARAQLLADARARVDEIETALRALADADVLLRPFTFLRQADWEIAARTWEQFRPVLPVDLPGVIYAATGLVLGLIVYELLKAPFSIALSRRRPRRTT